jgi:dTDP-4-dehydrorhamnose reductase
MKILVVGRGWTGTKVAHELRRRGCTVDTTPHHLAEKLVRFHDHVVNCAGVTGAPNVDACERNPEHTMLANAIFPILLQRECEKYGVRFSHFSSGCIYAGQVDSVDAPPNFFGSTYSVSKGLSDSYLKSRAQVFRIRMPFTGTNEPKNLLTKIRRYAAEAKVYEGGANSLSDHDEAVRVACDLVVDGAPNGAFNLVNDGAVTMHELVARMGLDCGWFTDHEFAQATVAARSNCVIPAYPAMRPLEVALDEAIGRMGVR